MLFFITTFKNKSVSHFCKLHAIIWNCQIKNDIYNTDATYNRLPFRHTVVYSTVNEKDEQKVKTKE